MVEREASGDFDYLWDNPADDVGLTSGDEVLQVQPAGEVDAPPDTGDDLWDEPDDNFSHFDAFDDNTWKFTPAPPPWYRTKQALTAMTAASAAMVAIVVAGVLLMFRGPAGTGDEGTSSVTPTAPTSAEQAPMATSAEPPPPLPPPPPETALPVTAGPRQGPAYQPRQTKAPEIGVTRTPVTRAPLSVAPQPRGGQRGTR